MREARDEFEKGKSEEPSATEKPTEDKSSA
jgi:hypothetical protein